MKLAFVALMSCLIAVSWQQHNQRHQSGANPYWSRPQYHQQLQSPYYHQNYPSFYPDYYRGPYSPLSAPSYPNYYQLQQRPLVDELKLMALLSQLSQEQQETNSVILHFLKTQLKMENKKELNLGCGRSFVW